MASELPGVGLIPQCPGIEPNLVDQLSQTLNNITLHASYRALVSSLVKI